MLSPDPNTHPLCGFFLTGYLSKNPNDEENFPTNEFPLGFARYERLFESALNALAMSRESLKKKSEFKFDSGNAANLEGGIGILRRIEALRIKALRIKQFTNIMLVKPKMTSKVADITAEKNHEKVCFEIKTVTKQSSGRKGLFFEEQLYEKILESVPQAQKQLDASAQELGCTVKLFVCVVNWFEQSIYLGQDSFQHIVNRLERDETEGLHGVEVQESLKGIDGVWFVLKMGTQFLFLNERGKSIDE
jgi:hypothetical protein